ncbi:MAG: SDR family oxidoreductase, partial [Ilumatobacteraceae bacterium]
TSVVGASGNAGQVNYAAAKAGVAGLTRSLAREVGSRQITVNCIAPVAASPSLITAFDRNPALQQAIEARTPLGRVGDITDDIGSVALFLAGDGSSYVTGQTIVCDGGSFLGL